MPMRILAAATLALLFGTACQKTPVARARVEPAPAEPICRVTGESQVVASNVWANRINVQARPDKVFEVAVVDVEPCLTVEVARNGSALGGPTLGKCPPADPSGGATATNGTETYVAREEQWGTEPPHLVLGVYTFDWPHAYAGQAHEGQRRVVERVFFPPAGGSHTGESMPALATFGRDRFVVVWVEGDDVRALPLARWAEPIGEAVNVSPPEARVVAHPSAAFASDGEGIVAYLARTRSGNHVLATPIACAAQW
jgi:hypothetical protein